MMTLVGFFAAVSTAMRDPRKSCLHVVNALLALKSEDELLTLRESAYTFINVINDTLVER